MYQHFSHSLLILKNSALTSQAMCSQACLVPCAMILGLIFLLKWPWQQDADWGAAQSGPDSALSSGPLWAHIVWNQWKIVSPIHNPIKKNISNRVGTAQCGLGSTFWSSHINSHFTSSSHSDLQLTYSCLPLMSNRLRSKTKHNNMKIDAIIDVNEVHSNILKLCNNLFHSAALPSFLKTL